MSAAVWFDERTGLVAARFSYDPGTVERLKAAIPKGHRRWDPGRRLWLVDPPYDAAVRRLLGLSGPPGGSTAPAGLVDALGAVFAALPEHLHEPTFRALLRVWHPDIGGDTSATQALNACRRARRVS